MGPPYIPSPSIVVDPSRPEARAEIDVDFSLQRSGGLDCEPEEVTLTESTLNRAVSGETLVDLDLEVPGGNTFDIDCYDVVQRPLTNLGTTNGELSPYCGTTAGIRLTFCRELCPDECWTNSAEVEIDCGEPNP